MRQICAPMTLIYQCLLDNWQSVMRCTVGKQQVPKQAQLASPVPPKKKKKVFLFLYIKFSFPHNQVCQPQQWFYLVSKTFKHWVAGVMIFKGVFLNSQRASVHSSSQWERYFKLQSPGQLLQLCPFIKLFLYLYFYFTSLPFFFASYWCVLKWLVWVAPYSKVLMLVLLFLTVLFSLWLFVWL